jgi:hypothetical protein
MNRKWIGALGGLIASAGVTLAEGPGPTPPLALPPTPAPSASSPLDGCARPVSDDGCDPDSRFSFAADYLLWRIKKGPIVPLVTTGPTDVAFSGSLDQQGTATLFGDRSLGYGTFSGLRLDGTFWLDRQSCFGVEASGFVLQKRAVHFDAAGDANGQPFLARPFVNALTGNENTYFVAQNFADPNLSAGMTGAVGISSSTRLWSWEANAFALLHQTNSLTAVALAGFRSLGLDEDLKIGETLSNVVPGGGTSFLGTIIDPPGSVSTFDSFQTRNRFYGPQLGGRVDWQRGPVSVGLVTKVALGVTQEQVRIDGSSTLLNAGVPMATVPGGILSQVTNSGSHFRNEFAVVPEVGLNLGIQITPSLQARIGYTFLYWSDVARPGAQVDRRINPGLVPTDFTFGTPGGAAQPAFAFHSSDFWAQGLNLGLEFRY